ncbi:hypothetical protein [Cupriavidus nantongensis]|uniref:Uncharacterized protein n=1 Tax=Cupriavidus nantongensis TaxID=1796606 RepID=A0A142JMW9_9BURK|nr:hypothetical protein [Cupriavidus nantongensis]AMR79431.1 hypothetical protein A2G96_17735 [Cupriavidus nantongensis]
MTRIVTEYTAIHSATGKAVSKTYHSQAPATCVAKAFARRNPTETYHVHADVFVYEQSTVVKTVKGAKA